MTPPRKARGARARQVWLLTASAVSLLPISVQAETVAGVEVSLGGTAASNPYLLAGDDTGSLGVNATIRPYVRATEGATTVNFDGLLSLEKFSDYDGTDESGQLRASIEHLLNERTTVSAGVGYMTSESAARNFYGGSDLTGLEPGEFPDPVVIDPTLGNIDGRTSRLDVYTALNQAVSPNGMIDLNMGLGLTRVESGQGQDYRDSSTSLTYSHRINPKTSLLFTADVGYADYLDRRVGDGLFATALVGAEHQLTETMYGSLQLGLSYADVKTILGGREDYVTWAASFNLCDGLARGTICLNASRSTQPTSLGGVTVVSAIGASYARQIGVNGYASLGASYSKSGVSDSPVLLGRRKSEIANVNGTYSHRLSERVSAYITPSFTANEDQFAGKQENYQVLLGISYRFGRQR